MTINITEDTYSWQSAASAAEECQYLNRIYYKEDLKVIFLTEWGGNWMEIDQLTLTRVAYPKSYVK